MADIKNIIEKNPSEQFQSPVSQEQKKIEIIPTKENSQEFSQSELSTQDSLSAINQQIQTKGNTKITPSDQAELAKEIENVLESGLEDLYLKMSKAKQLQFKQKGEDVSNKIAILLKEAKIRTSKILNLIMSWLTIIPGINKFFIRQEAKIKTDKIIILKNKDPHS